MIISASYRTDIPAFYGRWFDHRLEAGECAVDNPYSGRRHHIRLDRDAVDGFVFWTRRVRPFMATLERLHGDGWPFLVQYTVTGYPRALETAFAGWQHAVDDIQAIRDRYGPQVAVWRYDPILLTSLTPPSFHRDQIDRLASKLSGATDEVVLSFAHFYRKTRRNVGQAGRRSGFTWRDPEACEKRVLLAELGAIASKHGLRPARSSDGTARAGTLHRCGPSVGYCRPRNNRCCQRQPGWLPVLPVTRHRRL